MPMFLKFRKRLRHVSQTCHNVWFFSGERRFLQIRHWNARPSDVRSVTLLQLEVASAINK